MLIGCIYTRTVVLLELPGHLLQILVNLETDGIFLKLPFGQFPHWHTGEHFNPLINSVYSQSTNGMHVSLFLKCGHDFCSFNHPLQ
jgi:hypothetical protein